MTGNLVIPQTVDNNGEKYTVVLIGDYAFSGCELTSVILPQSVTEIGMNAFKGCDKLIAINLPNSLKTINSSVFENCSSLISIDIPDSVTDLGVAAFQGCSSLASVKLSHSLTVLNSAMFAYCTSLTSIAIPDGITSLGDYGFRGCTSLANVEIPQSVDYAGHSIFRDCKSLETIDISSVSRLWYCTFEGCSSLKSVKLSESLQSMQNFTFGYCTSLETIDIPKSVQSIDCAFEGCTNLKTITLPAALTSLDSGAFEGCSNLTDVYCYAATPPKSYGTVFSGIYLDDSNLYVPMGSKDVYASADGWKKFGNIFDTLPVIATKINLNRSYMQLPKNRLVNLTATVTPANCTDEIVWSTSDESIATVSKKGSVHGVSIGSAIITATCGSVSATCSVDVIPVPAEDIIFEENNITLGVSGQYQLNAYVFPSSAEDRTINWSISNPDVATVSNDGIVTAKSIGYAIVYAKCGNVVRECNVFVLPKSVSLDCESAELEVDGTKQLTASVLPEASTNKTITWASTNPDVVSVTDEGLVTALTPGVAVVTATCDEGSAFCIFTVAQPANIPEIKLSVKLGVAQTLALSAMISPEDDDATVVWSSSNDEIAEVSEDGVVTTKSVGVVVITATCGELTCSCIFVVDESSAISDACAINDTDVVVYSLQGIRMNVTTRDELNRLPAGYYIVNNKIELLK